jgi:hypothetical protein
VTRLTAGRRRGTGKCQCVVNDGVADAEAGGVPALLPVLCSDGVRGAVHGPFLSRRPWPVRRVSLSHSLFPAMSPVCVCGCVAACLVLALHGSMAVILSDAKMPLDHHHGCPTVAYLRFDPWRRALRGSRCGSMGVVLRRRLLRAMRLSRSLARSLALSLSSWYLTHDAAPDPLLLLHLCSPP